MGVKDLWSLLTPYMERKPLFELSNKVVAIDLSGWVCESLNVVDYFVHPRFYLRNLFFRTCYLLQTGITPVFVLEGTAPPLKYGVIVKRNQLQFRGARPRKVANCDKATATATKDSPDKPKEQKRNRFHHVLKQCEELLSAMGLVCVQAPGEAEALCAYLNRDNLIYGIISQDSDCFAYGAVRVFRNFCASQNGGSVEIYDLHRSDIRTLRLGQEKIVAMALLSGCDYCPAGVVGVGKELVTRFLSCYDNNEILPRIRSWRKTANRLTELEVKAEDKNICPECGHVGKLPTHRRSGCMDCRINPGCDESRWKQLRTNIKTELDIKRKALKDPDFPPQPIVDEFLTRPCELPTLDLSWKQPNLVKFTKSMSAYLQWNELYCFQKLLPLFTRWLLYATKHPPTNKSNMSLEPEYIKKKRFPKGVPSYEIVWKDTHNIFQGLIPQEQIDAYLDESGNSLEGLWSTIEPQDLIQQTYAELVDVFVQSKAKGKRKNTTSHTNDKAKPQKQTKPRTGDKEKSKKKASKKKEVVKTSLEVLLKKSNTKQTEGETFKSDTKNQPNMLNCSLGGDIDAVDHFLNFTAELDAIAEDCTTNDSSNLSDVINRLCQPNYLQQQLQKYMEIIDSEKKKEALQNLLSESNVLSSGTDDASFDATESGNSVEHRLVLKQDILNASMNSSHLDHSAVDFKKGKRMSFFFEPIDIPPPDEQGEHEPVGMDMFECSLMLKDRIVIGPSSSNDESIANQTIVYDIDF